LITEGEGITDTPHEQIMVLHCDNDCLSLEAMSEHITTQTRLAELGDAPGIRRELKRIVPEYTPWDGEGSKG
jgi:hypothetical protein